MRRARPFAEQIRGLAEGGVDLLLIETVSALNEAEQAHSCSKIGRPRAAGHGDGDGR